MTSTADKQTIGAEDLEVEGRNSPETEDLAPSKKLKVEDNSADEDSGDQENKGTSDGSNKGSSKGSNSPPELEGLVQNREMRIEKKWPKELGPDCESDEELYDEEYYNEYCEQVDASDGFDVGPVPYGLVGAIAEQDLTDASDLNELYLPYATESVKYYNEKQNAKLELIKIVKVNVQTVCGMMYYYTIMAKDDLGVTDIYQAQVERSFTSDPKERLKTEVLLFRKKSDTNIARQETASKEQGCGNVLASHRENFSR